MLLCICPFFNCPLELWESFAEWLSVFIYIYYISFAHSEMDLHFCFGLFQEQWPNSHDARDGPIIGRGTGFSDNHSAYKRSVSLNL